MKSWQWKEVSSAFSHYFTVKAGLDYDVQLAFEVIHKCITVLTFVGDDILNYLCEVTNLYAKQCHRKECLAVIGSLPILVNKKQMFCLVYEGGPKKNWNLFLEGGALVVQASTVRWLFAAPS
jgi:hypothetical protein